MIEYSSDVLSGDNAIPYAIELILRAQGREGIYALKVIAVPQAWTGLHERAALLISLPP